MAHSDKQKMLESSETVMITPAKDSDSSDQENNEEPQPSETTTPSNAGNNQSPIKISISKLNLSRIDINTDPNLSDKLSTTDFHGRESASVELCSPSKSIVFPPKQLSIANNDQSTQKLQDLLNGYRVYHHKKPIDAKQTKQHLKWVDKCLFYIDQQWPDDQIYLINSDDVHKLLQQKFADKILPDYTQIYDDIYKYFILLALKIREMDIIDDQPMIDVPVKIAEYY